MQYLYLLISPRILSFKNGLLHLRTRERRRMFVIGGMGLGLWAVLFLLSTRMLLYFRSVEVVGDILTHHLLAMALLTFFCLLIFSHMITALSNLYLSADLELCHASPSSLEEIFLSRFIYTIVDSSWMVLVFGLPVLMAYAFVFRPGIGYYAALLHMGVAAVIVAGGMGTLITMIMVRLFPAQRSKEIAMFMALLVLVCLYLLFRFLRPERLADPEAFFSIMQYMTSLRGPDSPYLPTRWVTETLWAYLSGSKTEIHLFDAALLWSTAGALLFINLWIAEATYFVGFSRSQEAKRRRAGRKILEGLAALVRKLLSRDLASVCEKDVRVFFRDNTQWTQLLLLGALVVVYLYNFSVLPLERSPIRLDYLQNEIAFFNMGLAGFVLSAIAARFIFPAVSSEGKSFWIVKSSPMSMRRFLWSKVALSLVPIFVLGEILTIVTNRILHVSFFMMIASAVTMALAAFGIVALAVGLGALYPNFKSQNIAQVPTSFGGLMYMINSVAFIALLLVLDAGPVYLIFMACEGKSLISPLEWCFIFLSFVAVVFVTSVVVYKPIKMGGEALERDDSSQ
jgi:ABC-2 type transport system permease protein